MKIRFELGEDGTFVGKLFRHSLFGSVSAEKQ